MRKKSVAITAGALAIALGVSATSGATAQETVFVTPGGKVGIGTAAPGEKLHVFENANAKSLILVENPNTGTEAAAALNVKSDIATFYLNAHGSGRILTGGFGQEFIKGWTELLQVNGNGLIIGTLFAKPLILGTNNQNRLMITLGGDIGIGTPPTEKLHVRETVNENTLVLVENTNPTGPSANASLRAKADTATVNVQAHGSGRTISRFGQTLGGWAELLQVDGNGLLIGTSVDDPLILGTNSTNRLQIGATGGVTVFGDFTATGVKSFAVVDPADSRRAIHYAALEGPEAGTYVRGTAKTSGGEAVIELPGYFARITEAERMTVQLTPIGSWGQLYVAEKTPGRLVVRTAPGTADLEFDYLVQGVRKGYLDFQVERENDLPQP